MSRKRALVANIVDLTACVQTADRLRTISARDKAKSAPWYRIEANGATTTEVLIYAEIGEWGVTALDFIGEVRAIATPEISVRINSPGGHIFDGFAIYNALLSHPARVTVHVDGVAASAASFIAQAGDDIVVARASSMMVHGGSGMCIGKAGDMREMADLLDKLDGQMAAIYAQRSERPAAEWLAQMGTDRWYTAEEAVAAGLADRMADDDPPEARAIHIPAAAVQPDDAPGADTLDQVFRVFQEV